MKKLLFLVLVLAMASLANATISMTLSGSSNTGWGTLNLWVVPSSNQSDLSMAVCIQGVGTLSSYLGPDAPPDSWPGSIEPFYYDGGIGEVFNMISYTSIYPTGVWLMINYSGAVLGDKITAYQSFDGNFDDVDLISNTITIVPEPATIALLCLGGLMIRRKK
jgi:hypothetical protein